MFYSLLSFPTEKTQTISEKETNISNIDSVTVASKLEFGKIKATTFEKVKVTCFI